MSLIKAEKIEKVYGSDSKGREISVLRGMDLTIEQGDFIGIMGRSGCGKTTFLKILGLIEDATKGELWIGEQQEKDLTSDEKAEVRRRQIGFVFQDFQLMEGLNGLENILLTLMLEEVSVEEAMERVKQLSKELEIEHLLEKELFEVSGGEKQRLAIARALMQNPSVILADEPTGNLDSQSGSLVMDIFQELNQKKNKTIVLVTHDPQIAVRCKKVLFMKDGRIEEEYVPSEGAKREKVIEEIFKKSIRL